MHRLATVHARDNQPTNQPTTNDVMTQPISISASFTNVNEALNNGDNVVLIDFLKRPIYVETWSKNLYQITTKS